MEEVETALLAGIQSGQELFYSNRSLVDHTQRKVLLHPAPSPLSNAPSKTPHENISQELLHKDSEQKGHIDEETKVQEESQLRISESEDVTHVESILMTEEEARICSGTDVENVGCEEPNENSDQNCISDKESQLKLPTTENYQTNTMNAASNDECLPNYTYGDFSFSRYVINRWNDHDVDSILGRQTSLRRKLAPSDHFISP